MILNKNQRKTVYKVIDVLLCSAHDEIIIDRNLADGNRRSKVETVLGAGEELRKNFFHESQEVAEVEIRGRFKYINLKMSEGTFEKVHFGVEDNPIE